MKISKILGRAFALALVCSLPNSVFAHAFLDHAEPKVGATVPASPVEVKIWFTQNVEPAFSVIEVQDAVGKEVDNKDTHRDDKDRSLLIVSLTKLPPGKYSVVWRVISVDTHRTQGKFTFTVK